ncbi:MAG: hypothetical protein IPP23_05420 [Sphingomonadales bacterium]|nr:hypothetical protein [Sphingomonadales bacterium]
MSTDSNNHSVRLFESAQDVRDLGEAMIACNLPRDSWTHEAHIAFGLWVIMARPDIEPERDFRTLISRFNESVGGVNSDSEGYHHSITVAFARGIRRWHDRTMPFGLLPGVNALLVAPEGQRDWPLRFFSKERLFSVEARREWIEPDLMPLVATAA